MSDEAVTAEAPKKGLVDSIRSFPPTYWVVIVMEFFERFAFYGMMAFLAAYFTDNIGSASQWGAMRTVLYCLLYLVPVFSGALAEKIGYKRVLAAAFVLMTLAYVGLGSTVDIVLYTILAVVMGLGGGLFKPVISGSIARTTDETNSNIGFGIYYWTINVGSMISSLATAYFIGIEKETYVFYLSAACVGLMFFNNLLFYREPKKPDKIKTFADSIDGIVTVCRNWRFLLLLLAFSGFWGLWDRSTDSALWLINNGLVDMTPVNEKVTSVIAWFVSDASFEFTVAHVTTLNSFIIIVLVVPVSYIVRQTKPLPTMITGIGLATLFPLLLAVSDDPWIFIIAMILLSIGEIIAYPKLISYVGLLAPKDKVAIYMGFVFLPVFFSSLIYSYPNGVLWERLVENQGQPGTYWFVIMGLGLLTIFALFVYDRLMAKKLTF